MGQQVGLCQSRISEIELGRRPVSDMVVKVVVDALAELATKVR